MDMIDSIEALFLYLGMTLFGLGFVSLFIKKLWRLGIISMLIADLPFAIAVAYLKKALAYMPYYTIPVHYSKSLGIASGILIFLFLFFIYKHTLMKWVYKEIKVQDNKDNIDVKENTDKQDTKSDEQAKEIKESTSEDAK